MEINFLNFLNEVIEDHAPPPLKTKNVRPDKPHFMNTRPRKENLGIKTNV